MAESICRSIRRRSFSTIRPTNWTATGRSNGKVGPRGKVRRQNRVPSPARFINWPIQWRNATVGTTNSNVEKADSRASAGWIAGVPWHLWPRIDNPAKFGEFLSAQAEGMSAEKDNVIAGSGGDGLEFADFFVEEACFHISCVFAFCFAHRFQ